jgi:hypothetical protein
MYALVLVLHSWLRWGALVAGILAVIALVSKRGQKGTARVDTWGLFFMIALDLQLLLGLALYMGLSPNMQAIRADFGAAMRDSVARFWAVEHVMLMLVAVGVVHVGRVLARKASTPEAKRSRLLLCFVIALLAIVAATPWPGLRGGRPLFRISAS